MYHENNTFFSLSFGFQADGEHPFSNGQSMDQEEGSRKRQRDEIGKGRVVEGSNGDNNVLKG